MSYIITVFLSLFTTSDEAEALQRTAPRYLTAETAMENLMAARVSAAIYEVDADLLLSTAFFESRYKTDVVGPVVRGKTACGVMQPIMETKCVPQTLFEGYLIGAKHLQDWYRACRGDERCALLGYGGGYTLINACAEGPVMRVRGSRDVDICTIPEVRLHRARWIKKERAKRSQS
jgi:hypothetical protein